MYIIYFQRLMQKYLKHQAKMEKILVSTPFSNSSRPKSAEVILVSSEITEDMSYIVLNAKFILILLHFSEELFYAIAKDYKDDPTVQRPEPSIILFYV